MGHWKAILREKFIALPKKGLSQKKKEKKRKQEKAQVNNLTSHLKELEKEYQTKPKLNRRKEIIKIRAEINKIES